MRQNREAEWPSRKKTYFCSPECQKHKDKELKYRTYMSCKRRRRNKENDERVKAAMIANLPVVSSEHDSLSSNRELQGMDVYPGNSNPLDNSETRNIEQSVNISTQGANHAGHSIGADFFYEDGIEDIGIPSPTGNGAPHEASSQRQFFSKDNLDECDCWSDFSAVNREDNSEERDSDSDGPNSAQDLEEEGDSLLIAESSQIERMQARYYMIEPIRPESIIPRYNGEISYVMSTLAREKAMHLILL